MFFTIRKVIFLRLCWFLHVRAEAHTQANPLLLQCWEAYSFKLCSLISFCMVMKEYDSANKQPKCLLILCLSGRAGLLPMGNKWLIHWVTQRFAIPKMCSSTDQGSDQKEQLGRFVSALSAVVAPPPVGAPPSQRGAGRHCCAGCCENYTFFLLKISVNSYRDQFY